jgi:hypothetical protein
MENTPILRRIYHPACGKSYYYALIRKRHTKEITDANGQKSIVKVRVYMCRNCAEEFSDLDIVEHEMALPQVNLATMSQEERMAFINSLYKKDNDAKPS